MDSAAATSPQTWETYYVLLGTAAATLLGLVFVTLSLGSGDIFAERTSIVFNIFVDPDYHLFFSALIIAVLAVIPVQSSPSLAICLIVLVLYNSLDHIKN